MGSINRYIFRTTLGAFLIVLVSLTSVIWVTQALRDIDLLTNQGQTILVFIAITGLVVPLLLLVIAPVALTIAVAYVLGKLSNDSEIIVMNAAGMSPWRLFRAFLLVAAVVSLMIFVISAYVAPKGLRSLHDWAAEVRADLVTNIVQPGRFTTIERGLTFHIRERKTNGLLTGILVDDSRDPKETVTILAEQGDILKADGGTFLVLQNGNLQRHEVGRRDPTLVQFQRYAFDLSKFSGGNVSRKYSVRERYLWELFSSDVNDKVFVEATDGQMRAELLDRVIAPIYPFAFVIIAFAYLGAPRTTRQSRSMSLVAATAAVALVRMIGFASTVFGVNAPSLLVFQYIAVFGAIVLGAYAINRGIILEPPAFITNAINALVERFARRAAAT